MQEVQVNSNLNGPYVLVRTFGVILDSFQVSSNEHYLHMASSGTVSR